jgi:hypothetical protein
MSDTITIEVLENGVLKIETGKVSMPNHTNAEGLIRELATGMGGTVVRNSQGMHMHTHEQGVTHEH